MANIKEEQAMPVYPTHVITVRLVSTSERKGIKKFNFKIEYLFNLILVSKNQILNDLNTERMKVSQTYVQHHKKAFLSNFSHMSSDLSSSRHFNPRN